MFLINLPARQISSRRVANVNTNRCGELMNPQRARVLFRVERGSDLYVLKRPLYCIKLNISERCGNFLLGDPGVQG